MKPPMAGGLPTRSRHASQPGSRRDCRRWRRARLLAVALACLIPVACTNESGPAGPDDDVPVGLRIHLNGALVTRIDGTDIEGFLHVHVGEYSGQFLVSAINGAGNTIDPAAFRLEAEIADPTIAAFVQPSAGALEGEVVAETGGATHLMLELWRGPASTGNPAFTAPPIEVLAIVCPEPVSQPASSRASASNRPTTSASFTSCAPRTRP